MIEKAMDRKSSNSNVTIGLRRYWRIVLTGVAMVSCLVSCKQQSTGYQYDLLLDLMYGMEITPGGRSYELRDSLLESIPLIEKRECVDVWYHNYDNWYCQASLGMYYDKEYPTPEIKRRVSEAVDTLLINEIGYYFYHIAEDSVKLMREFFSQSDEHDMFQFGEWLFNAITPTLKNDKPVEEYWKMYANRICMVTHKVFENDSLVTYIVESSIDYNGSCGCPSSASYYTYRKFDGYLFTTADLTVDYSGNQLEDALGQVYDDLMKSRGYESTHKVLSNNVLSTRMDGCAIIEEGLLVYYHPYNIGVGAEGQYNLIIKQ